MITRICSGDTASTTPTRAPCASDRRRLEISSPARSVCGPVPLRFSLPSPASSR